MSIDQYGTIQYLTADFGESSIKYEQLFIGFKNEYVKLEYGPKGATIPAIGLDRYVWSLY